jgi:hypothetical protein
MSRYTIDNQSLAEIRAQALLIMSLAHRDDLVLRQVGDHSGFDYLVSIAEGGSLNTNRLFWIDLKAAVREVNGPSVKISSDLANTYAGSALPLCLFFYAMNNDAGHYVWMVKPHLDAQNQPDLLVNPRLLNSAGDDIILGQEDFTAINASSLASLVDAVNAWYDARKQSHLEAA